MAKMPSLEEIELLAQLLARAGVSQIEALWANGMLNRLRAIAAETALLAPQEPTA